MENTVLNEEQEYSIREGKMPFAWSSVRAENTSSLAICKREHRGEKVMTGSTKSTIIF